MHKDNWPSYTLKQWCCIALKVVLWLVIIGEPLLILVLRRFFSGSLAWLRGYIAPLPYTEPLLVLFSTIFVEEIQCIMATLMVLHSTIWQVLYSTFKDMALYSTKSVSPMTTIQEPLLVLYITPFLLECSKREVLWKRYIWMLKMSSFLNVSKCVFLILQMFHITFYSLDALWECYIWMFSKRPETSNYISNMLIEHPTNILWVLLHSRNVLC